jgi:hypothetical protein
MKTALAIVCSLLLIGTLFVPASAPAAGDPAAMRGCCCDCSTAACCAAAPSPEPLPVSAAPLPSTSQNQFLPPATARLAWTLPGATEGGFCSSFDWLLTAAVVPLFARNCARLI